MHQQANIQVVTDQPGMTDAITCALGRSHHFHAAASLVEAQAQFRSTAFDLVIAHLNDEHQDGLAYLTHLRRAGILTPFILLTELPSLDTALQSMRLGVAAYLPGPVYLAELKKVVDQTLDRLRDPRSVLEDPQACARQRVLTDLDQQGSLLRHHIEQIARVTATARDGEHSALRPSLEAFVASGLHDIEGCLANLLTLLQHLNLMKAAPEPAAYRGVSDLIRQAEAHLHAAVDQLHLPAAGNDAAACLARTERPPAAPQTNTPQPRVLTQTANA